MADTILHPTQNVLVNFDEKRPGDECQVPSSGEQLLHVTQPVLFNQSFIDLEEAASICSMYWSTSLRRFTQR